MERFEYTALIVEPRIHPALEMVLLNFCENLGPNWEIKICHGTQNKEFIENIIQEKLSKYSSRINLYNLNVENLTFEDYNNLFLFGPFYDIIQTETFLVFQTDSYIVNPEKIEKFIGYDYVGAPWGAMNFHGNGGLSLRKKSKMLEILDKYLSIYGYSATDNEDMIFSGYVFEKDRIPLEMNKPTYEEAKEFSVETVFYEEPFGIHAFFKHMQDDLCNKLYEKYPELKILRENQMF